MSGKKQTRNSKLSSQGCHLIRQVFPLLRSLADDGIERDKAKQRQFTHAQYAALILVGLFNPILSSARSLVAASGTRGVRKLTGGRKVSLGSFSEATSVFNPERLQAIVDQLKQRLQQREAAKGFPSGTFGDVPEELAQRVAAIDGSILGTLPGLTQRQLRQWRLHVCLNVATRETQAWRLTEEPSRPGSGEREMASEMISSAEAPGLYLLDRGYRGAELFNQIVAVGGDYVARLNRNDGVPVVDSQPTPLSEAAQAIGITADEQITFGGTKGSQTEHTLRRITLVPLAGRPSSARQGRPRTDQSGREELVLATSLTDLPAEQIVALYEHRWTVELFFRFLKHSLGCQHLLSTKTEGVAIQIYCTMIAALLLSLVCGRNITKRQREMIALYFSGWADPEDLAAAFGKPPPDD